MLPSLSMYCNLLSRMCYAAYVSLNGYQLQKIIKRDASVIFALKSTERPLTVLPKKNPLYAPCEFHLVSFPN